MLSVVRTSRKSTPRGPQRRVDHSMSFESVSSSATELVSASELADPKRRTRPDRSCGARDTISGLLGAYGDAHGGWGHMGRERLGRGMAGRSRPHARTCATSPSWLGLIDARIPGASIDLCTPRAGTSAVDRQASHINLTVEMVEARPMRVASGCGQQACQVAG